LGPEGYSTTFVNLVMEAAAIESLREEAAGIEQEMQRLLSEVEQATDKGSCRAVFFERFMELLRRRGETARKTAVLFEQSRDRSVLSWLAGSCAEAAQATAHRKAPLAGESRRTP
jgi:hypothetical protein